jgi:uncharacterized membrane protein
MSRHRSRWLVRRFREAARDNQWLIPLLGAVSGLVLAMLIGTGGGPEEDPWTLSVDRSRDTLSGALALVFTAISIVLALASVAAQNVVGRFGSRVMRIYARVSPDRWVIGGFALTAMFILVEQFQLRRLDPDAPAPIAGLVVSVLLLICSGTLVIAYIGSVVRWFRVDRAVAGVIAVARESARAITRQHKGESMATLPERPDNAVDIPAPEMGHIAEIDADVLLGHCRRLDALAVITEPIGTPVVVGQPVGWIASRDPDTELHPDRGVHDTIDVSRTREVGDSIEYGLFGLVDIAIMALSPAVNDPNSALEVIEEMSFLFQDLADVPLGPYAVPDAQSWPRAVVQTRTFGELLDLATTQIVDYGLTDPMVVRSLREFAAALQLLDLNDADRAHVDAFAAKLEGADALES